MLQYSTYSVISPEGCASILWKSAEKAADAAEALGITSQRLHELELIDEVIPEPLGSAYRDLPAMAAALKSTLKRHLDALDEMTTVDLVEQRYHRLMSFGAYKESD